MNESGHRAVPANEAGAPAAAPPLSYVLITPARNEEAFIERTIQSIVAQTQRPAKWLIVSDGSTDRTDEIVRKYAAEHDWIELLQVPERAERHFAGKAHAFNTGYARLKELEFDIIGSIDADTSFTEDTFAYIVERFAEDEKLGLAGPAFVENDAQYDYRFTSIEHVWGGCQIFRRTCFEQIGGYVASKGGGIDVVAVWSARTKGWKTRTFAERQCTHYRVQGTAKNGPLKARFLDGRKDYCLGGHPLWELFRGVYQMRFKPYILGGLMIWSGYLWSILKQEDRTMPPEMIRFRRADQMKRLKSFFGKFLGGRKETTDRSGA